MASAWSMKRRPIAVNILPGWTDHVTRIGATHAQPSPIVGSGIWTGFPQELTADLGSLLYTDLASAGP